MYLSLNYSSYEWLHYAKLWIFINIVLNMQRYKQGFKSNGRFENSSLEMKQKVLFIREKYVEKFLMAVVWGWEGVGIGVGKWA